MRNSCISFLIVAIIILSGLGLYLAQAPEEKEYLRIHIRADSNATNDQTVKYKVKDAVVNFLTPKIAECNTRKKAEKMLSDSISGIEMVANGVLSANGFTYTSKASVKTEVFPTRFYGDVCLEKGSYRAIIIELGSGQGDNWWCVVYPPLCFTGSGANYQYRSKIKDLLDEFFLKKEK